MHNGLPFLYVILPEHQCNQLGVWRKIRNDVAHGNFDNITQDDIERMIAGVKQFVQDEL